MRTLPTQAYIRLVGVRSSLTAHYLPSGDTETGVFNQSNAQEVESA